VNTAFTRCIKLSIGSPACLVGIFPERALYVFVNSLNLDPQPPLGFASGQRGGWMATVGVQDAPQDCVYSIRVCMRCLCSSCWLLFLNNTRLILLLLFFVLQYTHVDRSPSSVNISLEQPQSFVYLRINKTSATSHLIHN
jgi:hypothetical protein